MEIRFAKPDDVSGILSLLRQVGQVHRDGRPDIFRAGAQKYSPSQVLTMLNQAHTPIFVAVDGQEVAGYCFCQLLNYEKDPVISNHKTLYIDDLCVDEGKRGQHIGKTIYDHVCRFAKEQGCYNITLNVWTCNPGAVKFYQSMGMMPQKLTMERVLDAEEK